MKNKYQSIWRISITLGTAVFILAAFFAILPTASASITANVGDVIVHEIMQNPSAVSDGAGEWFEVYNTTSSDIDINGWTVEDNGSDSFVIDNGGTLFVPANGYLVLGNNADSATNGGVSVDYEYTGMFLANGDDEIILIDETDQEINRVEYDGGPIWPDPNGASMALRFPALDNNIGANWCVASTAYGDGDFGTPGTANDCPMIITKSVQPSTNVGYQENVTYTVALMNGTAVSDTNVLFTDTLPISTTFSSWLEQPAGATAINDVITWTGTVTNGEIITFRFVVEQNADYSETITNTAEFSGTTTADTAEAAFTVEDEPQPVDINVTKTGPEYGIAGESINYTIVISNDGSLQADNVLFTDTLPVEIDYVSNDYGMPTDMGNNVYVWDLGNLAGGTAVTINLTGTVTNTLTASTLVTNTASAASSAAENDVSNNEDTAETTLTPFVTIYDIQYTTDPSGDSPYRDQSVTTEGVVTAVFANEVFIQDGDGAWNGVMLYRPSGTLSIGDYIRVTGDVTEYFNMTEFAFGAATTVISSSNTLPAFEMLPSGDVSDEQYESVLVQVNNVIVSDEDLGFGEWAVNDGSGDIAVDNLGSYGYNPSDGESLLFVRGPLNYSFSAFKIAARDDNDIALGVSIEKDAPILVGAGELLTYTITVENQLGETLNNVVISDVVPADTTFAYALDGGIESGGVVTWSIVSLAHASNVSVQFAVTTTNVSEVVNDDYVVYADNYTTPLAGPPVTTIIGDELRIFHIQGEGFVSPFVGQTVTVAGEVVADFQGDASMRGFFMQDPVGDSNALTSDGIFVYDENFGVDVSVGDVVTVTGNVAEYQNMTEINVVTAVITEAASATITPTLVTLPETTNGDLERYEGMWVTLNQTMTVAQNYFQGRYGQVSLSANGRLFQPTNVYTPTSVDAINLADSNARNLLILDDGSTASNPDPVPYIGQDNTLRAGDTTNSLLGVLDEGRINSSSDPGLDYRLHPRDTAIVSFTRENERTDTPVDVGGRLQIASFNVLNYFTTLGGSAECGPNQDLECRGADTVDEFIRQRTKIITALVSIDADVVGLMEIENNETAAITDLVTGLNDEAGPDTYDFIDTGYIGGDAIKVAMIYQPAKVTPVGTTAVLSDVFPFNTNTRPPLAQAFIENATGSQFVVVVNHFKSKGSPCDSVDIPGDGTWIDPDIGDGQGNCNLTRVLAANELVSWLNTNPTESGGSDIFIIGDLNSYAKEDPIVALEDLGYTNLIEQHSGTWAYSYIFDAQSGYLDHALASPSAVSAVTGVTGWHINADEPSALDYNDYNSPTLYQPDAFRSSDHDPILLGIDLEVPTVEILSPTAGEVFTSTDGMAVSVPVTITTTNFVIPTDGHWHIWVDGVDNGPVMAYDTTVDLLPGAHVITAELYSPSHTPLGIIDSVSVTVVEAPEPTVTILSPLAGEVFTSTNGTAVSVPVTITTTDFVIPTNGHWHIWVDGVDNGPVMAYDTTVDLLPGAHVITAELYSPSHTPLGIVDSVSVTVNVQYTVYLPVIMKP